eukprot:6382961-Pyramimonas_sp.AAC.1
MRAKKQCENVDCLRDMDRGFVCISTANPSRTLTLGANTKMCIMQQPYHTGRYEVYPSQSEVWRA